MDLLSESELKISNKEIMLIKRIALKLSKKSTPDTIIVSFNISIGSYTVKSNREFLKSKRISENEIKIYLPRVSPGQKTLGIIVKCLINPESYRLGGLRVIEWPSLDLYKVSTIMKPYQILGFKKIEQLEPHFWQAIESVTSKVVSHIAKKRSARIELLDHKLPTYYLEGKLVIDSLQGGKIKELELNIPQTNKRHKTKITSSLDFTLITDENDNQRIRLIDPSESGEITEISFIFQITLLEIEKYQSTFNYPTKDIYRQFKTAKNKRFFEGNYYWNTNDTQLQQIATSTSKMQSVWEVHRFLFEFVNRRINYSINGIRQTAKYAYYNQEGDCSEFSDLLITLHRLGGIPSRLKEGYILVPKENGDFDLEGHAWVEFLVPNGWVPCDPTWGIPIGITSQHIDYQTHLAKDEPSAYKYTSIGTAPIVSWSFKVIRIQ